MPTPLDRALQSKNLFLGFAGVVGAVAAWSIFGGDMFPREADPTGDPAQWTETEMRRWLNNAKRRGRNSSHELRRICARRGLELLDEDEWGKLRPSSSHWLARYAQHYAYIPTLNDYSALQSRRFHKQLSGWMEFTVQQSLSMAVSKPMALPASDADDERFQVGYESTD